MKSVPGSVVLLAVCVVSCASSERPPALAPTAAQAALEPAPIGSSLAAAGPASSSARPVAAKVQEVVDVHHGVSVRDPYRWMEGEGPELQAFLAAQDASARRTLAAIPGRDEIRDAIRAAGHGVARVRVVGLRGSWTAPRIFFTRRLPDEAIARLYLRDGFGGADRMILDLEAQPELAAALGPASAAPAPRRGPRTFDDIVPSPDGKHVACVITFPAAEESVVVVLEVERGRLLPERIDRTQFTSLRWLSDRSFFYWRQRKPAPGDAPADWLKHSATYLHTLGDDPERARPVISSSMPELGLSAEMQTWVAPSGRSRWVLAYATPSVPSDVQYFVTTRAQLVAGKPRWRRISSLGDQVTEMTVHGDTIYARSYAGAPRFRVLAFDARRGSLATARVAAPEQSAILESFAAASDALYLQYFDGGKTRVTRLPYDGARAQEVPLPFPGTAQITAEPDRPGLFFLAYGWIQPLRHYTYDPQRGVREVRLRAPWPVSYEHLTAELVELGDGGATAAVPMSILRRKDTPLDGRAPALLEGYQAYGVVEQPTFSAAQLAWVERGGVLAYCHGRGTGNRGKAWHTEGIKQHKERGVDDFLACAEHLIDRGYTSAARLSALGVSAGGLVVGGAVTRRPERFAAALFRVAMLNLLRAERIKTGPANVAEMGSVAEAEGFAHLLASDPYHRLRDGVRYPALLISAGAHDTNIPSWVPAKFVARAQAASGSGRPILLRLEADGGHFGSTPAKAEEELADLFAFALWQSGVAIGR